MENLKQAQKLIELLISETPTGEIRNKLTEINILLSLGILQNEEFMDEINRVITLEK